MKITDMLSVLALLLLILTDKHLGNALELDDVDATFFRTRYKMLLVLKLVNHIQYSVMINVV